MNQQKKNTNGFERCFWDVAYDISKAELVIKKKVTEMLEAIRAKVKAEPKKY